MVSVVSSRVRPSFSNGTANRRTSSTKARAAISPAHSPADTRALPRVSTLVGSGWGFRCDSGGDFCPAVVLAGGATLAAGADDRRRLAVHGPQLRRRMIARSFASRVEI